MSSCVVYTSSPVIPQQVQAPVFVEKGLTNQTTGRPGELHLIGRPEEQELSYMGYQASLPAFLYATATGKKVSTLKQGYKFSLPVNSIVHLDLPALLFQTQDPIRNDEDNVRVMEYLGDSVEPIEYLSRRHYIVHKPTPDVLNKVQTIAKLDNRTPVNATNLIGIQQIFVTLKILTAFLATHTYPAFQTDDKASFGAQSCFSIPTKWSPVNTHSYPVAESEVLARRMPPTGEFGNPAYAEGYEITGTKHISGGDCVLVAKPAPFRPEINVGSPSEVPAFPGYVVPYFPGLINSDISTLPTILRRFFLRCFGSDNASVDEGFSRWRKAWSQWFKTDLGLALTHIFLGIQAAIEGQARFFLMKDNGRYTGHCLLGYRFHVMMAGRVITPGNVEEVRKGLADVDAHYAALKKIIEMLKGLSVVEDDGMGSELSDDGLDDDISWLRRVSTGRKLHTELNRARPFYGDQLEELRRLMAALTFTDPYLPINKANIVQMLDLYAAEEPDLEDLPLFVPPTHIYDTSREYMLLGAFGPTAPSFINQQGSYFIMPRKKPDGGWYEDAASRPIDDGSEIRQMETILVGSKKLDIAITDLKNVKSTRKIRQNPSERAAGYRNVRFHGAARDEIWEALKNLPAPMPVVIGKAKGKRVRDEDDHEGGPTKKTREAFTGHGLSFDEF